MNTHTVRLGLHSYSFENHFPYKTGFDAFAFICEAERLGLSGVHISMNEERYRWVGGTSPERLRAVGAAVRELLSGLGFKPADTRNGAAFVKPRAEGTD